MAIPVFVDAGAGVTITGTSASVTHTASVGNFLILQVLVDTSAGFPYISGGSGFEDIAGTDGTMDLVGGTGIQVGAGDNGSMRNWVGRATNASVSITVDTNASTNDMFCRIYQFSGASIDTVVANVIESTASQAQGTSTTIGDADPTTTGTNELAVNLVGVTDPNAVGAFTGMSGGTWAEAVAEYASVSGTQATIQLQTASMASPGTISGGTFVMSGSAPWGVQGLAIKSPSESTPVTLRTVRSALRW